jgi:transposase
MPCIWQLASGDTKAALISPASSLPTNNQFLRLCRALHNRKNFLFVGDVEAGDHLATLYSLVSTCEARDIDPVEYLKDVLLRVDTHPASRIDELLPQNWKPPLRWTDTS